MKTIFRLLLAIALMLPFTRADAAETINGAGATFPYPVYSAWAYDYHKETKIRFNYQSIGSGGGIRQIKERTVDFGASDAPLKPDELNKDNLLQFPAVIGGVVPVVNIPEIGAGKLKLDPDALCRVYLGEIKYWDDNKIKELNPDASLSHKEIVVVHRSDGSGTTAIFTDYLSGVCADWKSRVGSGTSVKWPAGIGGKGNEGVANYVKRTPYSIGYVEFAYAKQNNLAHIVLKNHAGNFVEPSFETFDDAAKTADFAPDKHFYLWLTNAPGKDSWPIAGATFILMAKDKKDSNIKTARFFDWAFKNGDNKAKELIYIPLPDSLKNKVMAYLKENGIY